MAGIARERMSDLMELAIKIEFCFGLCEWWKSGRSERSGSSCQSPLLAEVACIMHLHSGLLFEWDKWRVVSTQTGVWNQSNIFINWVCSDRGGMESLSAWNSASSIEFVRLVLSWTAGNLWLDSYDSITVPWRHHEYNETKINSHVPQPLFNTRSVRSNSQNIGQATACNNYCGIAIIGHSGRKPEPKKICRSVMQPSEKI